jgi:hypothetical protein
MEFETFLEEAKSSREGTIFDEITRLVERLDFLDIQILRKFYVTNKPFPNDSKPWCFPLLFREMKDVHHLKIGLEGFRKRLDKLVRIGLLGKIKHSNPVSYTPIQGKERFVRLVITKFFLIHGLTKFL